jgi:hypothetical protein
MRWYKIIGVRAILSLPLLALVGSLSASAQRVGTAPKQLESAAQFVADEPTNLQVLRLVFPKMRISVLPKQPAEKASPVTDPFQRVIALVKNGLEHGAEYDVVGPVAKDEEDSASDITDPKRSASQERKIRMEAYRWNTGPNGGRFLVAVLSYEFVNANPPRCCHGLGKIVLLSDNADRVLDTIDKMPYAFTMFTSVQFLKGGGTGAEKLMIGADFSGVGTIGINSAIFDVVKEKLNPLLSLTTMVLAEADIEDLDIRTLEVDERRTPADGKHFFFVEKTYASGKQILTTPRTETVSFPVGTGVPLNWQ